MVLDHAKVIAETGKNLTYFADAKKILDHHPDIIPILFDEHVLKEEDDKMRAVFIDILTSQGSKESFDLLFDQVLIAKMGKNIQMILSSSHSFLKDFLRMTTGCDSFKIVLFSFIQKPP